MTRATGDAKNDQGDRESNSSKARHHRTIISALNEHVCRGLCDNKFERNYDHQNCSE